MVIYISVYTEAIEDVAVSSYANVERLQQIGMIRVLKMVVVCVCVCVGGGGGGARRGREAGYVIFWQIFRSACNSCFDRLLCEKMTVCFSPATTVPLLPVVKPQTFVKLTSFLPTVISNRFSFFHDA